MLDLNEGQYLKIFYRPGAEGTWWINIDCSPMDTYSYFIAQYLGKYYNENILLAVPKTTVTWQLSLSIDNIFYKLQTSIIVCWDEYIINGIDSGRIKLC